MAESFLSIQSDKHKLLSVAGWGFMAAYKSGKSIKEGTSSLNSLEFKRMSEILEIPIEDGQLLIRINELIENEAYLKNRLSKLFSPEFAMKLGTSRFTKDASACHSVKIKQNLQRIWRDHSIYAHLNVKWNPSTEKYITTWELPEAIEHVRHISISLHVIKNKKEGHFVGGIRDDGHIYLFDPNGQFGFFRLHNGQGHEEFGHYLGEVIARKFKEDEIHLEKGPILNVLQLNTCEFDKGNCTCWVIFLQTLYWDLRDRKIIGNVGYANMLRKVLSQMPMHVVTHLFMNFCSYLFKLI